MTATVNFQLERWREERFEDTAGLASAWPTFAARYLNNFHAHRGAPLPIPGWGFMSSTNFRYTGAAVADTSERWAFEFGVFPCPPGYSRIRYNIVTNKVAGTSQCEVAFYFADRPYNGSDPTTQVIDTTMLGRYKKTTITTTGGIEIWRNVVTTIPFIGSDASGPYLGSQVEGWGLVYCFFTIKALGTAGSPDYRINTVSMKLEP